MGVPSFTKTWRKSTCPAIDPRRPELSAKDKTVIVTGAGSRVGSAVGLSFAQAGAPRIALVCSTQKTLQETKAKIEATCPDTTVFVSVADVSIAESMGSAAHHIRVALGAWDVFVSCTAHVPNLTTMTGADEEDWWKAFEINVRFFQHFAKHFLPKRRPDATYIDVNGDAAHLPAGFMPKTSAYAASKLAAAKLDEYLALENSSLRVFTVHPGVLDTQILQKHINRGGQLTARSEDDDLSLPGDFTVGLRARKQNFCDQQDISGQTGMSKR